MKIDIKFWILMNEVSDKKKLLRNTRSKNDEEMEENISVFGTTSSTFADNKS